MPSPGLAVANDDGLIRFASGLVKIHGEIPHFQGQTHPEFDILKIGVVVDAQFEEWGFLILDVSVEGQDVGPGFGAVAAAGEEGGHP